MTKTTWLALYEDFKKRHPNLSKTAFRYVPHNYAEILIYCNDGSKIVYNYDDRRARFDFTRNGQAVI